MDILIVKIYPLSELFNAMPVISVLQKHYNARISLVTHEYFTELATGFMAIDRVIAYPENELKSSNRKKFREDLNGRIYDIVIDLEGSMESALVCKKSKKKKKTEILGPSFQREGAHVFYSRITGNRDTTRHPVYQCMDVLDYLNINDRSLNFNLDFKKPNIQHLEDRFHTIVFDSPASIKNLDIQFWLKSIERSPIQVAIFTTQKKAEIIDELEEHLPIQKLCLIHKKLTLYEQAGLLQSSTYTLCHSLANINLLSGLNRPGAFIYHKRKAPPYLPIYNSCKTISLNTIDTSILKNPM